MKPLSVPRVVPICAVVFGCAPTDLGRGPEFLWWTDHETGNTTDWTSDGKGKIWVAEGGELDLADSPARSGRFSMRSTVVQSASGFPSSSLLSRLGDLPREAYYSAWFFVPQPATLTDYWLFFKFRSRTDPSREVTAVDLWDLDLMPEGVQEMTVRLYHHDTGDVPPLVAFRVPLRRWFQAEAFLRATSDTTGQLIVWLDGVKVFDVSERATVPAEFVEWSVGAATEVISPATATLYVDDAAITSERLGPDFPVFWRGE